VAADSTQTQAAVVSPG